MSSPGISENSRRIARNTVLLYFRMGVMMLIGLITYRIIIRTLGIDDYGVYSVVGGVVTMAMLVMNTVSSAISRFITVGLGEGNPLNLKKAFGTSVLVMAFFCVLLVLLAETLGVWYLHNKLILPEGRMAAAEVVLQTSLIILVLNLLSVPYTAVINAHEHMGAYAWISILEAVLKLLVALGVWLSPADKLVTYAWLLLAVAFIARGAYALYSFVKFPETHFPLRADRQLVREMGAFAGWNFVGSGAYMLNTQGVNQLMNVFGVQVNAARGIADKVEQIVRQFATNIALALNPALTKAYVSGNKEYAFELVYKGSKYYFWILWTLFLPFLTDAGSLLRLWLGEIPPEAALFTSLTLLCFVIDFTPGTLNVLEQANGRIRRYYIYTSLTAVMAFVITFFAYRLGAPAYTGYVAFVGCYLLKSLVMLRIAHQDTGLPIGEYWKKAIAPAVIPGLITLVILVALSFVIPEAWWRFFVMAALSALCMGGFIWRFGLTPGEKAYVKSKLQRS